MFVAELDRPWLDTPFLLQGFLIEEQADIDALAKHCQYVFVDRGLSKVSFASTGPKTNIKKTGVAALFPNTNLKAYQDSTSIEEELLTARRIMTQLSQAVTECFTEQLKGQPLSLTLLSEASQQMVDSMVRNPDAMLWLNRLKAIDNYTYQHAISVSIWMVALGRQLGLPKDDLCTLSLAGLLLDIGKTSIPNYILEKTTRLTPAEFALVKRHIELGLYEIEKVDNISSQILETIEYHHERFDGSGYPKGVAGSSIPVFARIAAIADCYDAITTIRPYAPAVSPSAAVKKLFHWRNKDFQSELIEEFIQAIGIYPAGSLVELSSGEVGIVLAEYRSRRLRPKIIQLLDRNKVPLHTVHVIDMLETTHDLDGSELNIINSLEPEAFDIDISQLDL